MKVTHHPPFIRRAVRKVAWFLHGWSENRDDARMDRNGELWLLGALAADWSRADRGVPRVVIDAGANRGDFTAAMLTAADAVGVPVTIYACEPGAEAFAALAARFAGESRVHVVNAALADFDGTAPLYAATGASEVASLVKRDPQSTEQPPTVRVSTLATLFETCRLQRVDFLKLDIEGAELAALHGCRDWLAPATIGAILFEYGGTTLDAGTRLRDFFDLLTARGYRVAKLFPRWIEVRSYQAWLDNFYYSNWVAVPE